MFASKLSVLTALLSLAALGHTQSTDQAALSSSIDAVQSRLQNAYTTASGWGAYSSAESSFLDHYLSTQTIVPGLGAEPTGTGLDPAGLASMETQLVALTKDLQATMTAFVATQTYLPGDVRSSILADYGELESLVAMATDPLAGLNATTVPFESVFPTKTGTASAVATTGAGMPSGNCDEGTRFLVDTEDCNVFYICDNGVPKRNVCGEGLYINPEHWVCDWPRNVDCKYV